MRAILIAAFILSIPVGAAAQSMHWQSYAIPETGARVDLPTAVFLKDGGEAKSGHGHRFETDDRRANVTVQSVPNDAMDSPAAFLAKMDPPSDIVYRRITARFFVVSGFRDDKIWYDRCNAAGRLMNCVLINYPAAEKRKWDPVVTRISNTLASE
jgi:hypothetical protein